MPVEQSPQPPTIPLLPILRPELNSETDLERATRQMLKLNAPRRSLNFRFSR